MSVYRLNLLLQFLKICRRHAPTSAHFVQGLLLLRYLLLSCSGKDRGLLNFGLQFIEPQLQSLAVRYHSDRTVDWSDDQNCTHATENDAAESEYLLLKPDV